MQYIITFLVTFFLSFFVQHLVNKKRNVVLVVATIILSVLPLCILAGLRHPSIGTDTNVYIVPWFNRAVSSSYGSYISYVESEKGFFTFLYFASNISKSLFWPLFLIEFLIVFPLALSTYFMKDKIDYRFFVLVFCLLLFNDSLCYMRQLISGSFVALSFVLLTRKKYFFAALLAVISPFFHMTAVALIIFIVLVYFVRARFVAIIATVVFFFIVFLSPVLANILHDNGLIGGRYYESFVRYSSEVNANFVDIFMWTIFFIIPPLFTKKSALHSQFAFTLVIISAFGFLSSLGMLVSGYFYRLTFFARVFIPLYIPYFVRREIVDVKYFSIKFLAACSLPVIYWFYFYPYLNYANTFPYVLNK